MAPVINFNDASTFNTTAKISQYFLRHGVRAMAPRDHPIAHRQLHQQRVLALDDLSFLVLGIPYGVNTTWPGTELLTSGFSRS